MIEVDIRKSRYADDDDSPKIGVHDTEHLTNEAKFVLALVERWGMVNGIPDGEDSAGRAKIGIMPVDDVVGRAFELSLKTFERFRSRGGSGKYILQLPTIDEMKAICKTREEEAA